LDSGATRKFFLVLWQLLFLFLSMLMNALAGKPSSPAKGEYWEPGYAGGMAVSKVQHRDQGSSWSGVGKLFTLVLVIVMVAPEVVCHNSDNEGDSLTVQEFLGRATIKKHQHEDQNRNSTS
jgi:hypothetical protein